MRGQGPLGLNHGCQRIRSPGEGDKEGVTFRTHLTAVPSGKHLPQQAVVVVQQSDVLVT